MHQSIIKDNNSLGDFLNNRKDSTHIIKYREELGINSKKLIKWNIDLSKLFNNSHEIFRLQKEFDFYKNKSKNEKAFTEIGLFYYTENTIFDSETRTEENLRSHFWMVYNFANQYRKLAIVLSAIFYALGIIMVLIVFAQSIYEEIKWV